MYICFKFLLCLAIILSVTLECFPMDSRPRVIATYDTNDKKRILNYNNINILGCIIDGTNNIEDYYIEWFRNNSIKLTPNNGNNNFELINNELLIKNINDDVLKDEYTCKLTVKTTKEVVSSANFKLLGKPTVKIISQSKFKEGQPIIIQCDVDGYPKPQIVWRYESTILNQSYGRYKILKNNETNLNSYYLHINDAKLSDRGEYACKLLNVSEFMDVTEAVVFVRIKSKLSILWPIIGILIEVIAITLIIYLCERRRKKLNRNNELNQVEEEN